MSPWKSWQLGETDSLLNRLYDHLRRLLNQRLVHFLCQHLPSNRPAYVLEAGSGSGFASSLMARAPGVGCSVALDIDLHALAEARQRDPQLPVVAADLNHLPFKSASFDLVWNSSTMEHLDDPAPALLELSRLVNPDGLLFIGVPYRFGPLGVQTWFKNSPLGIWIGPVFDPRQLEQWMQVCAFTSQSYKYYFFNFFIGVLAGRKR